MRTEHCTARQGQKKTPLLLVGDEVSQEDQQQRVLAAVRLANTAHYCPKDDVVAVKVQYGDALGVFMEDLKNLRGLARLLSKSEIAFDLVSAVDELSGQVKLEFDFRRCGCQLSTAYILQPRFEFQSLLP